MENKKEEDLKKIIISEKTLSRMSSEFLKKLEQNNIRLVVVGNDMIADIKMIAHKEHASIVILSEDEQQEMIEQKLAEEENKKRIFEIKSFPVLGMEEAKYLYLKPEKKQKHYVPRTIGKANSRKRGGR